MSIYYIYFIIYYIIMLFHRGARLTCNSLNLPRTELSNLPSTSCRSLLKFPLTLRSSEPSFLGISRPRTHRQTCLIHCSGEKAPASTGTCQEKRDFNINCTSSNCPSQHVPSYRQRPAFLFHIAVIFQLVIDNVP